MYSEFQVLERDLGYSRIVRELKLLNGSFTKAGLPMDCKTSGKSSSEEVINYAAINEMGEGKIPERSFIRSATDENRKNIFWLSESFVNQIIAGKELVKWGLSGIGDRVVNMIKHKIENGPFQKNVYKKGHDMPLVETGQLYETIQHKDFLRGGQMLFQEKSFGKEQ